MQKKVKVETGERAERKHARYCDEWISDKYEQKSEVGSGGAGSVFQVCNRETKNCELVKKVSNFLIDSRNEPAFLKEVYFLRRLSSTGTVPLFVEAKHCDDFGIIVSEKMDMSLASLLQTRTLSIQGQLLSGELHKVNLLSAGELQQLVDLATKLGRLNVVHGDTWLANLLVKKEEGTFRFYYTDFGHAGDFSKDDDETIDIDGKRFQVDMTPQYGWIEGVRYANCSRYIPRPTKSYKTEEWSVYVNLFILEWALIDRATLISGDSVYLFNGFDSGLIPDDVRQLLDDECGEDTNVFKRATIRKHVKRFLKLGIHL